MWKFHSMEKLYKIYVQNSLHDFLCNLNHRRKTLLVFNVDYIDRQTIGYVEYNYNLYLV